MLLVCFISFYIIWIMLYVVVIIIIIITTFIIEEMKKNVYFWNDVISFVCILRQTEINAENHISRTLFKHSPFMQSPALSSPAYISCHQTNHN